MIVKRYKQIVGGLQENADGDYVDYSDYQKLVAENAALRVAMDGVNSELYGKGFEVLGWHLNGDTEPLDSWFEDNDWDPETPVTDAAIAEIGAKAIESFVGKIAFGLRTAGGGDGYHSNPYHECADFIELKGGDYVEALRSGEHS